MGSIVFYSLPCDGPAICAVELQGNCYEIRRDGYGGFGLIIISEDELLEVGGNMLEISEEEAGFSTQEILNLLSAPILF